MPFRLGDWKVVYIASPGKETRWQLFNLATDPSELDDLAAEFPERVSELSLLREDHARQSGML